MEDPVRVTRDCGLFIGESAMAKKKAKKKAAKKVAKKKASRKKK